jgi:hypothetical protein
VSQPLIFNAYLDTILKGCAVGGLCLAASYKLVLLWTRWILPAVRHALQLWVFSRTIHRLFGDDAATAIFKAIASLDLRLSTEEVIRRLQCEKFGLAIYICDAEGACVWVNDALCELFHRPPERMLGFGWASALDESEMLSVVKRWTEFRTAGVPYAMNYQVHGIACHTEAFKLTTHSGELRYIGFVKPIEPKPTHAQS